MRNRNRKNNYQIIPEKGRIYVKKGNGCDDEHLKQVEKTNFTIDINVYHQDEVWKKTRWRPKVRRLVEAFPYRKISDILDFIVPQKIGAIFKFWIDFTL